MPRNQQDEAIEAEIVSDSDPGAIALRPDEVFQLARETYQLVPRESRYPELYQDLQALAESRDVDGLLAVQKEALTIQVDNSTHDNRVTTTNDNRQTHTTTYIQPTYNYFDYSQHTTQHHENSHNQSRHDQSRRTALAGRGGSGQNHGLYDAILICCFVAFVAAAFSIIVRPMLSAPSHQTAPTQGIYY